MLIGIVPRRRPDRRERRRPIAKSRGRRKRFTPSARTRSATNGLVARSWPKVDIGPWPGTKAVSSPIGHSRWVIESSRCWWLPRGKSVRPIEPWNSTSPTSASFDSGWWKTTWPGVWPGQWRTSKVSSPTVDRVAVVQPAVGLERLAGDAVARAVLLEPGDPEAVVLVRALDRHAELLRRGSRPSRNGRCGRG